MAPKRRRDEAEKAEEEKDHTTSTKCGLAGLLSEKIEADGVAVTREESLAAVDFLVAALTRLRFEALCLLGLVAVRMCEDARREGQGLQPHCATCRRLRKTELVEDDMYAAICAVSVCDLTEQGRKRGRPSKRDQHPEDDLFRHVCEEHFPRDEEAAGARVNRSGLTPFLPPLSKGVFTNVKNHYAANFAAWLARSFRCRIDDELRELRTPATKKLDKLAWSMAHAVLYDGELEQPRWWVGWAQGAAAQAAGAAAAAAAQGAGPAGGAAAAQAWTALVDYVNAQRASKRAAELLLREVKGTQATYKKASTRHMEWAAEILAGLEARRDQLGAQVQQLTQAQPLTREDTQRLASLRRELHRARPFTLTPSPSFAPIYVLLGPISRNLSGHCL